MVVTRHSAATCMLLAGEHHIQLHAGRRTAERSSAQLLQSQQRPAPSSAFLFPLISKQRCQISDSTVATAASTHACSTGAKMAPASELANSNWQKYDAYDGELM
jgi:hypothetical protein